MAAMRGRESVAGISGPRLLSRAAGVRAHALGRAQRDRRRRHPLRHLEAIRPKGSDPMTYTFRRAVASEAKPLIGLYSESGCGKTKRALLLAKGFTGDMASVGMIETEAGRGEAYADDPVVGGYNVLSIREDFSPKAYGQAI